MQKKVDMICAILAAVLLVSSLEQCGLAVCAQEMTEEVIEQAAEEAAGQITEGSAVQGLEETMPETPAGEADTVLEAASNDEIIPNDETGIPDRKLYQAILYELGKSENDVLTKTEAESMESFNYMGEWNEYMDVEDCDGIESLKGIGYLKNLRSIHLQNHKLQSLDGIEGLTKLEYLNVSGGLVKNMESLKNLKSLKSLYLLSNRVTSLDGIEDLENLIYLNMQDNRLTDLDGIERLKNLTSLNVSANKLTSLDGVEKLEKLEKLDASYNKLKKLPNLKKLDRLKYRTCDLTHNLLKEKEIRKKVPKRFLKGGGKSRKGWVKDNTQLQNLKYAVEFKDPSSKKKINKNTKKIVGKTIKNARVTLYSLKWDMVIKSVKADKNGVFKMNVDLEKYAGGKVEMMVMVKRACSGEWEVVKGKKRVSFSKKKENVFVVKR